MHQSKDTLLSAVRNGEPLNFYQQLRLSFALGMPAILAQFSSVMMQYIDASMVGRLGAGPSASIGVVSTSTWITGGFAMGLCSGFSVQVAQLCGAKNFDGAKAVVRQGLFSILLFGTLLAVAGISLAPVLPGWLGADSSICPDASAYFRIYSAFLPMMSLSFGAGAMLQGSGNMKVPSILSISMCVLDVIFNYIFIFAMGMGVRGAALGTGLAEAVVCIFMLWFLCFRSSELRISGSRGSFLPQKATIDRAARITGPMWLQNIVMRGAHIASTVIVAPLGPISIAANAFAITAESFCYMPGYGLEEAATSLVGQSIGARRKNLARRFAWITTGAAASIMTVLAVLMFFFADGLMGLLSTDPQIVQLGARCLRIEAFAETMYAVSIVAYGACVGAGDTIVPTGLNFASMWLVRIGLALILTPKMGLLGYWIAMCIELNVRGALFLVRLRSNKWTEKNLINESNI